MLTYRHWCLWFALAVSAIDARAGHPFLCCDYPGGRVCVLDAAGNVEWEYACKAPQDCWQLPNGNILLCHRSGAIELTRDKTIAWEYRAPTDVPVEVHSCQPLPDGRVLLVECGPSRLLEIDRSGRIAKAIKLVTSPEVKLHMQFRGCRKLANGHYLVCCAGEGKVVELDESGNVVRRVTVPGNPHNVLALADGHWLITCGDGHRVIEIDRDERIVWQLQENDLPGHPLRLMTGLQRLPNGNTVFCNYLGHGFIGRQPQVFEITRDKQIAWVFDDREHFKSVNQVQLLDVAGDVTRGEILR